MACQLSQWQRQDEIVLFNLNNINFKIKQK